MSLLALTPKQFRAWLEHQPSDAIAGSAASSVDCPTCHCLIDMGLYEPRVYFGFWSAQWDIERWEPVELTPIPLWVDEFIAALYALYHQRYEGSNAGTTQPWLMTFRDCLAVLDTVAPKDDLLEHPSSGESSGPD